MKNYKRQKEVVAYFEANNYGYSNSHKMNNARYKIYKVFDKHIHNLPSNQDFILKGLIIDLEEVLPELQYILMVLHRVQSVPDNRRGWETYGFDTIEDDFMYIAGKWMCEFRVQWMIDAIYYYKMKEALTPTYIKMKGI